LEVLTSVVKRTKDISCAGKEFPIIQNGISFIFIKGTFICLLIISSTSRNMASLFSQSQTHCSNAKKTINISRLAIPLKGQLLQITGPKLEQYRIIKAAKARKLR
jgi:hypothetical protein